MGAASGYEANQLIVDHEQHVILSALFFTLLPRVKEEGGRLGVMCDGGLD